MPSAPWSAEAFAERRRVAGASRRPVLTVVATAAGLGIAGASASPLGPAGPVAWWAGALAVLWAWHALRRAGRDSAAAIVLLVAVACAAGAWQQARWRFFAGDDLGRLARAAPQPVCVEVIALAAPTHHPARSPSPLRAIPSRPYSRLTVRVCAVRDGLTWRAASGQCELFVDGVLNGVAAGDALRLHGQLAAPPAAMNPGQFDRAADRRGDRQLAVLRCDGPEAVATTRPGAEWRPLTRAADACRAWVERTLTQRLGPERGPLASAMVVGLGSGLPEEMIERFRRTGELHALVVSGMHVSLVMAGLYLAARLGLAPRGLSIGVIMLAIAAYTLVTGAQSPAVRAAVLGEVFCLAALVGRPALAMNSLGVATLVVLSANPAELFRPGAQLSFLSAATLIALAQHLTERRAPPDPMRRLLESARGPAQRAAAWLWRWAGLTLLATLAVWLATAPLLAWRYHLLSPVALPLALVVLPATVAVTLAALATLLLSPFAPLAGASAALCGASADLLSRAVELGDRVPGGSFYLAGPPGWWVVGAYALLVAWHASRCTPWGVAVVARAALAWVALGLAPHWAALAPHWGADRPLRCTTLAVGHGLSVVVQAPNGATLLYDAGALGEPAAATETIANALWALGVRRIDALVVSHADIDHFNAVPGLLERFRIERAYLAAVTPPRRLEPDDPTAPAVLMRALAEHGVPVLRLVAGDRLRLGATTADVLHPDAWGVPDTDNANSLVLAVEHAGRRVLLPGDLEGLGLTKLLEQEPYPCDVLVAPHHGSIRSDPPGLAAWCRPAWVVLSGGAGDRRGSAAEAYLAAGARVSHTGETGAATFTLAPAQVTRRVFAAPHR